MIELIRNTEHRWRFDKNVSDMELLLKFASMVEKQRTGFSDSSLVTVVQGQGYNGRSKDGSSITMGVRVVQAKFYMLGYVLETDNQSNGKIFMLSPTAVNAINTDDKKEKAKNCLVSLWGLQYPHPYNRTPEVFNIYAGRLIVKLLLEPRLANRLYIDEMIWFLPFVENVNETIYKELVDSIIEFRSLSYEEKTDLFKDVPDSEYIFGNVAHEVNYYFIRLFASASVFEVHDDASHNGGRLLKFKQGTGNYKTFRNDAYKSGAKCSGYVTLSDEVRESAGKLLEHFSVYDEPTSMNSDDVYSQTDWLTNLYEIEPLSYLNVIKTKTDVKSQVSAIVHEMVRSSKFGSRDGKEFENALKPFIELFRETVDVEILSGAGNTDLLCTMDDKDKLYKMNVDAKTRQSACTSLNPVRLSKHLRKHGSKFCIVVAPKFSIGVNDDIKSHDIVVVRSEEFGAYCYHECIESKDNMADFSAILDIVNNNKGKDITPHIRQLMATRYGVSC